MLVPGSALMSAGIVLRRSMEKMRMLFAGPRLLAVPPAAVQQHGHTADAAADDWKYAGNVLENGADYVMGWMCCARGLAQLGSPVLLPWIMSQLYRRTGTFGSVEYNCHLILCTLAFYIGVATLRATGRATNPSYLKFLRDMNSSDVLQRYDTDTLEWVPQSLCYRASSATATGAVRSADLLPLADDHGLPESFTLRSISGYAAKALVHTHGRHMMYPGTMLPYIAPQLSDVWAEARRKMSLERGAARRVLLSSCGDRIDTMHVRAGDGHNAGDVRDRKLLVTCEGNAGFYEVGAMTTPLGDDRRQFDVLGWNQPGFAASSGLPWPKNVAAAMEVVLRYAIDEMGYQPGNVYIYAWSIGGFPATHGARCVPALGGLFLDATFDDVLPLAENALPAFAAPLVRIAIRCNLDLPVSRQLQHYDGAVLVMRRRADEIISTDQRRPLQTNRGNVLIKRLLQSRYPHVFQRTQMAIVDSLLEMEDESDVAATFDSALSDAVRQRCAAELRADAQARRDASSPVYPSDIGADASVGDEERSVFAYYLLRHYWVDFDGTHNAQLHHSRLSLPKQPWLL